MMVDDGQEMQIIQPRGRSLFSQWIRRILSKPACLLGIHQAYRNQVDLGGDREVHRYCIYCDRQEKS